MEVVCNASSDMQCFASHVKIISFKLVMANDQVKEVLQASSFFT